MKTVAEHSHIPVSGERVPESLEVLEARLEQARDDWRHTSAKRNDLIFNRRIGNYKDQKHTYNETVVDTALAKLAEEHDLTAGLSDEGRAKIEDFLFNEYNTLTAETDTAAEGGRIKKALRGFTGFLNKGSKKAAFAKNMIASAIISAGTGAMGAVGGGIALMTLARIHGGEVGKLEKAESIDDIRQTYQLEPREDETAHDYAMRVQLAFSKKHETSGKLLQNEKRTHVKKCMGNAAIAAAAGGLIGLGIHEVIGIGSAHAAPVTAGPDVVPDGYGATPPIDSVSGSDYGATPPVDELLSSGHGATLSIDTAPEPGHGATPPIDYTQESSHGATLPIEDKIIADEAEIPSIDMSKSVTVNLGDGYTSVLTNAAHAQGIDLTPEQSWELHKHLVDELGGDYLDHVVDGKAVTDDSGWYQAGESKYEIGLNLIGEHVFKPEAQELITSYLHDVSGNDVVFGEHGATPQLDTGATSTEVVVSDSPELVAPQTELPAISKGEGINQFVQDHYGRTLTPEQSLELGKELHDSGYAYKSDYLQAHYGNPYGLNAVGEVDTGMNAIVNDMAADGKIDGDWLLNKTDWLKFEAMLGNEKAIAELNAQAQPIMKELGPLLKGVNYNDGSPVVSADAKGVWNINASEHGLPQKALNTIYSYLSNNEAAANALQKAVK